MYRTIVTQGAAEGKIRSKKGGIFTGAGSALFYSLLFTPYFCRYKKHFIFSFPVAIIF